MCRARRRRWLRATFNGLGPVALRPHFFELLLMVDLGVGLGLVDLSFHLVDLGVPLVDARLGLLYILFAFGHSTSLRF
jgi:hypothetical protein